MYWNRLLKEDYKRFHSSVYLYGRLRIKVEFLYLKTFFLGTRLLKGFGEKFVDIREFFCTVEFVKFCPIFLSLYKFIFTRINCLHIILLYGNFTVIHKFYKSQAVPYEYNKIPLEISNVHEINVWSLLRWSYLFIHVTKPPLRQPGMTYDNSFTDLTKAH